MDCPNRLTVAMLVSAFDAASVRQTAAAKAAFASRLDAGPGRCCPAVRPHTLTVAPHRESGGAR